MQQVPFEEKVANLGECDLAFTCHAVQEEFENEALFLFAGREECGQFVGRIGHDGLGGNDISRRVDLAAILLFLIKKVQTVCIAL